jgi:hypothetical protein
VVDEKAKRRPGMIPEAGVKIELADGQEWAFPQPVLELRPRFAGGKVAATYPVVTCGRELDELLEAISEVEDSTSLLSAAATLGAHLLLANYDLTDAELDTLFCVRPSDPTSAEWVEKVVEVAAGQHRPKASAVG